MHKMPAVFCQVVSAIHHFTSPQLIWTSLPSWGHLLQGFRHPRLWLHTKMQPQWHSIRWTAKGAEFHVSLGMTVFWHCFFWIACLRLYLGCTICDAGKMKCFSVCNPNHFLRQWRTISNHRYWTVPVVFHWHFMWHRPLHNVQICSLEDHTQRRLWYSSHPLAQLDWPAKFDPLPTRSGQVNCTCTAA